MSTLEVANILSELEFVEDCTVYGVPVPHTDGKCGMAAFTLKPGEKVGAGMSHATTCCSLSQSGRQRH